MQKPPSVSILLGPSRLACAAIALIALSTFAVLVAAQVHFLSLIGAACTLALWASFVVWRVGLRRGTRAVRGLRLNGDDSLVIDYGDGTSVVGRLRASSSAGARFTTLVWRPQGSIRSRSVLILPDMLPAETFRRLRVLMRYGRSDDKQGEPASHA